MRTPLKAALSAMIVPFVCSIALVAAQPATSTLSGTVTSVDGARLPRALLTLIDPATGKEFSGASDDLGAFVLDRLPAGTYQLLAEFPGLASATETVVLGPGNVRLDIVLEPRSYAEVVTVSAAVPRDSVEVTEVRESPARDVGELLADSAGIWKVRKGGIANDVVLRGLQSRDLNVLIDGNRLYGACPNDMDPTAFHVDFSEVERVDVGKGPFDVRYQGSLGGIVNIVTRKAEEGWHADTSIGLGSNAFVNPSTTVSFGGSDFSMLGGYSYRQSDPYTDGRGRPMTADANYRPEIASADAFRAGTAWGRASWTVGGHEFETSYTRQRTDDTLYPYLMMDAVWDNADRLSVDYSAPDHVTTLPVKAQVYWSAVDHFMTDQFRTSSAVAPRDYSMATDATTMTVGGRVDLDLGRTSVGGEAYRRNWNSETLMAGMAYRPQYSIPDVNIDAVGVFAEHTRILGTRTSLDFGGRIDRIASAASAEKANTALYLAYHGVAGTSRADVLPSGRVKLAYQVSPEVDLGVALGHTARVPEANERFFALRRMGTDWVGNPGLDPARNTGIDLSVALRRPRVSFTANGYFNAVHDYVAVYNAERQSMVPGVMNTRARSYANVDARLRGFEASGSVTVHTPLSISGDLSYVRGTMTPVHALGITTTDLAETPPLRGRLAIRLDDGRLFGELEGMASAAQTRVDTTLGEQATPSYGVVNLSGGIRQGRLGVTLGLANVFDTYYVEHLSYQRDPYRSGIRVAEPGRTWFANAAWRF